jgi:hypothetical protein
MNVKLNGGSNGAMFVAKQIKLFRRLAGIYTKKLRPIV